MRELYNQPKDPGLNESRLELLARRQPETVGGKRIIDIIVGDIKW